MAQVEREYPSKEAASVSQFTILRHSPFIDEDEDEDDMGVPTQVQLRFIEHHLTTPLHTTPSFFSGGGNVIQ